MLNILLVAVALNLSTKAAPTPTSAPTPAASIPTSTCSEQAYYSYCAESNLGIQQQQLYAYFSGTKEPETPEPVLASTQASVHPAPSPATTPTPTPTTTPAPEATHETTPDPTPEPTPNPTPDLTPEPKAQSTEVSVSSLNPDVIFTLINQHRQSKNLPPFEKDPKLCAIAEERKPQLQNEIYGDSYIHAGFKAMDLPYWITENQIAQPTEAEAMQWWLNSSLHRSAIESDKQYSCGACSGNVCIQLFTSWQAK